MEPKQSDKEVAFFFSAQKFVIRVLIRLVEVANVETIYHHELLEYSFSKKIMENFKKWVWLAQDYSLYSKNSPQLCTLLNPSLVDLKTFRSLTSPAS